MAKRTASAKKQARAGARRAARNRAARSEVKTLIIKARRSLRGGSGSGSGDAPALLVEAVRSLDRAAAKGVLHRNNAARRKSRLAKGLAKVVASASAPAPAGAAKGKKGAGAAVATPAAPAPAKKK